VTFDYAYNIATDFYGGFFNDNSSSNLSSLSKSLIPATALENINSGGGIVTLTYASELSPAEKIVLDNNTSNPAGGIVGRCNDYLQFIFGATPVNPNFPLPPVFILDSAYFISIPTPTLVSDTSVLVLTADGSTTFELVIQYTRGDGVVTAGYANIIDGWANSIMSMGADYGPLDDEGKYIIRLGPSYDVGTVILTIYAYYLQPIVIPVKFFQTVVA
jgi:hypothetical protein